MGRKRANVQGISYTVTSPDAPSTSNSATTQQQQQPEIDAANVPATSNSETNLLLTSKQDQAHKRRKIITMVILFVINLINYVDRFTVAGTCFILAYD